MNAPSYHVHITKEHVERMKTAVNWAYDHPITAAEMVARDFGKRDTEPQPNAVTIQKIEICFTIEEKTDGWTKHLMFFMNIPGERKVLSHDAGVAIAHKYFGYRFDGQHQIFVAEVPGFLKDIAPLITHIYETV